jgi:hypothetical protein
MTQFVILTDEPEKLRRAWDAACDWTVTAFESAADALFWERQMCRSGAVALEGQGFHYGVRFVGKPA